MKSIALSDVTRLSAIQTRSIEPENNMKAILLTCVLCVLLPVQMACAHEKTRLIIMADMGNEPDEEQQMVHMLMYSNMFDLEGLIACSGKYLHDGKRVQGQDPS